MKSLTKKSLVAAITLSIAPALQAASQTPSMEEMWQLIQQQQQMLKAQKAEIERLGGQAKSNEEKIEATSVVLEKTSGDLASVSKAAEWFDKTSIGGYGELHYNHLDQKNSASSKDDKREMDLHRFVLFFNHEFNEDLRLFTELEVEHALAGEGKEGEVEVEQAYVEYDLNDNNRARAGVFLMPFGFLNETHEPPTFYGVERNPVEKNIIPATWWEGGIGLSSRFDNGISTDVNITSGLKLTAADDFKIRSGRQKVSEAEAKAGALSGRIKYSAIPGLELAASAYFQNDLNQSNAGSDEVSMYQLQGAYNVNDFTLKALYAHWDLDADAAKAIGADEQEGWYVEPSYKITPKLGVFARYNEWDNKAGDSLDSGYEQFDVGMNYWLDEDVVLKADYQWQDAESDTGAEYEGLNLGVGYQF